MKERWRDSIQVRDFLGEDYPISEVLFTRVMRLGIDSIKE